MDLLQVCRLWTTSRAAKLISAVFTMVAALWGQVEYRAKQTMPWKVMRQGPAPAATTVLLDYVSPMNILALFAAIRASHFFVALAIAGSLLVKLLTIVSTGLFTLRPEVISNPHATLSLTNKFDGSSLNIAEVNFRPVYTVYGMNTWNLTTPFGTADGFAVQTFNSSNGTSRDPCSG